MIDGKIELNYICKIMTKYFMIFLSHEIKRFNKDQSDLIDVHFL